MKKTIAKLLPHSIKEFLPIRKIFTKYGFQLSIENKSPQDSSGDPLPWFTYPSIEYLSQLDISGKKIFEWGSGNSSSFFAKRCHSIVSVEHNEEWFSKVKETLKPNQSLFFEPDEMGYANKINIIEDTFDIIIIDGMYREQCVKEAFKNIKPSGLIILDNSERYPDLCAYLRGKDLIQIDMHGFGPINTYCWTTTLFLTRQFNFIPNEIQPTIPIGGVN